MRRYPHMHDRRTLSTKLSVSVVAYLRRRRHRLVRIAYLLGVSPRYLSLVRSRERSLTIDHLDRAAELLGVPLATLLLSITPLPKRATPDVKKFFDISTRVIEQCQIARDAILGIRRPARP